MATAPGPFNPQLSFALQAAAQLNNVTKIQKLIEKGADVNAAGDNFITPLHRAAQRGLLPNIEVLLAAGANPNARDKKDSYTPLHYAVQGGFEAIVDRLLEAGADVNGKAIFPSDDGSLPIMTKTPLQVAITGGYTTLGMKLLEAGAVVNAVDRNGTTLLHVAVKAGQTEIVQRMIQTGASVNEMDAINATPLMYAAAKGHEEVVNCLLEAHAELEATDAKDGHTALQAAAVQGHTAIVERLVRAGANIHHQSHNGQTALYSAAMRGHEQIMRVLMQANANIHTQATNGSEAIHISAAMGHPSIVQLLIESGVDVNAPGPMDLTPLGYFSNHRTDGFTPLHHAIKHNQVEVAQLLVTCGADMEAKNLRGHTPLAHACHYDAVTRDTIAFLISHGAQWPFPSTDQPPEFPSRDQDEGPKKWTIANEWMKQRAMGIQPLTTIPDEVYERGVDDILVYFEAINRQQSDRVIYRTKVCVVGPSTWGKTSFLKSFTTSKATLESLETRTIGIDLYDWEFTHENATHHISMWDFAGQDEYHPAHSLFYSKRTLYLLCVNLQLYVDVMEHEADQLDQFFESFVYRWVRIICAHEPSSDFVLVGTKSDLLPTENRLQLIEKAKQDLLTRFKTRARQRKSEITAAMDQIERKPTKTQLTSARLQRLQQLVQTQATIADQLIVFSSADLSGMDQTHTILQQLITETNGRRGFRMPQEYRKVLELVQTKTAVGAKTIHTRVCESIVNFDEFLTIVQSDPSLSAVGERELRAILHTLHDLGDLLWYDTPSHATVLQQTLFLSPSLVIEFIRKIINHTDHNQSDGLLTHRRLHQLPYWQELSSELTLQLKSLLHHFRLVYPSKGSMAFDSDLIVPVYWKKSTSTLNIPTDAFLEHVGWEYTFETYIPDDLFEKLAVQSYSSVFTSNRVFGNAFFALLKKGQYAVHITQRSTMEEEASSTLVLSLNVWAVDRTVAWTQLTWYASSLEKLLQMYPGLLVTRFSLYYATGTEALRFKVDDLVSDKSYRDQVEEEIGSSLLPDEMQWYTGEEAPEITTGAESVAQTPSSDKMEHHLLTKLEHMEQKFENMLLQYETRRKYPPLWTLQYSKSSTWLPCLPPKNTLELRIRSCLSGKCFHDPIRITIPAKALATYHTSLRLGISLFCGLASEVIPGGVMDLLKDECLTKIQDAKAFHTLMSQADLNTQEMDMETNQNLTPDGINALLSDFIRLVDPEFRPIRFAQLSKLECAVHKSSGKFLWASRHEIQAQSHLYQIVHDYAANDK